MAKVIYISGGQRSGKSSQAMKIARQLSNNPIYIATARIWDEDFKNRVEHHKSGRDKNWTTIEEEKYISKLDLNNKVVVLDCVTLWITNFFSDNNYDIEKSLSEAKAEWDEFIKKDITIIAISNEIGMGIHAETPAARKFTDLQGWINQYIAKKADEAIFMVSGNMIKIK